jgi:hypothetical protein
MEPDIIFEKARVPDGRRGLLITESPVFLFYLVPHALTQSIRPSWILALRTPLRVEKMRAMGSVYSAASRPPK